jgi:tRNA (mo5U34)-methyltransferase
MEVPMRLLRKAALLLPSIRRLSESRERLRAERDALLAERDALLAKRDPLTDIEKIKKRVGEILWTHVIDLGNGIVTPGLWRPGSLSAMGCPDDLRGMKVLDLCAADGAYSFQAERLGAASVLATDSFLWGGAPGTSKAAFDFAREVLNSRVESKYLEVLDHSPETAGVFDLVLFIGVLYHMRNPLLALERVFSVTGKQAIIESHVDMLDHSRPAMAFYPGDELNGDTSNWWGPNVAAVEAMLRVVGFQKVNLISLTSYQSADRKAGVFKSGQTKIDWSGRGQGRAIWNAWR